MPINTSLKDIERYLHGASMVFETRMWREVELPETSILKNIRALYKVDQVNKKLYLSVSAVTKEKTGITDNTGILAVDLTSIIKGTPTSGYFSGWQLAATSNDIVWSTKSIYDGSYRNVSSFNSMGLGTKGIYWFPSISSDAHQNGDTKLYSGVNVGTVFTSGFSSSGIPYTELA